MSSEGFTALEINGMICSRRARIAAHPVGCDSLLQIVMTVGALKKKFELAGLAHFKFKKKVGQMAVTFCSGWSHPTRSLSRIVCRGRRTLKAERHF